ncbi:hypothetical protein EYF80_008755 [Liparis tanakae]|uniref:Uncharacterized protein n=1 Tax=Liparis tanakae TaxID=230148 RepID=A0A4Z2ISW6_9TELE|nr:hypothetical protein EYF80_008755 [Liparis tanakae]
MGEERGRQSGGAAAADGGLPADVWSEVGGLSGRLLVEDEEKLFALLAADSQLRQPVDTGETGVQFRGHRLSSSVLGLKGLTRKH